MIPLVLACSAPPPEVPDLAVSTAAKDVSASGGTLTVTTVYTGESVELPDAPTVDGLTFALREDPRQETLGARTVVTQVWRFSGKKGSYEIPSLAVTAGEQTAESAPLWVDLGVETPHAGELLDIQEPDAVWTVPWTPILCGVGGFVVLSGMLGLAFSWAIRPRETVEVVLPPDVRWLRAWHDVREDPMLTDEDRARELSRIFREYTEEVLGFPAVSWTTSEILEKLESLVHLPSGNVPRAKRLLRATDLVKYAEVKPGEDFFQDLDGDLRSFIAATRPTVLTPTDGEA